MKHCKEKAGSAEPVFSFSRMDYTEPVLSDCCNH
jgi:hypothetical protein